MTKRSKTALLIVVIFMARQTLPAAPIPSPGAINTRSPQLNRLDPKRIPAEERRPWHPAELVAILGNQRGHHWQALWSVSYSPDGNWIATDSRDRVYVWAASGLRFHALLPIEVNFAQFVPEKSALLTCDKDGVVQLWDVKGAKPRSRVLMRNVYRTFRIVLSPDGKKLVVPDHGGFSFYDMNKSPAKHSYVSLGESKSLLEANFSHDSLNLVTLKGEVGILNSYSGSSPIRKQEVTLWDVSGDVPKARCALTGPSWQWGPMAFSRDGKMLVCGANLWDFHKGKPSYRGVMSDQEEEVFGCHFLPDSRYAITTGYNWKEARSRAYLRVRDMRERVPRVVQSVTPKDGERSYQTMALSPDAKHLAVGEGNCLHVWEMKGEKIQVIPPPPGHTQAIKAMSFGACGNLLATIARDGTLRLWNLDGPRPHERLIHKHKFGSSWDTVALSPDATKVAAGFLGGCRGFTLWEITPSGLRILAEHKNGGQFFNFSPDSKMLFASDDLGPHKVIDLCKPKEAAQNLRLGWRGGSRIGAEAIVLSPDGQTLVLGGNYELEVWRRSESGWQKQLNAKGPCDVKSMSFGGRGNTLLIGGGSYKKPEVHLYNLTGDSPKPIAAFTGLRDVALSVTASSSGKLFAACDETGRVVVWSASGKKLHEWTFPGPVHCVSFAPDGRHLALGNGDGTVYILRLTVPTQE